MIAGVVTSKGCIMVATSPSDLSVSEGSFFFLMRGDDEVEEVESLEVAAASSMRCWVEASSFRCLSKSTMKSVMPNWCMTETSSAWSQVCMLWTICLTMRAMELWVVNGEFTITPRHSTWR